MAGLGSVLSGLFGGGSGSPYKEGMNKYQEYLDKATAQQQPFYQAGTGAIPDFQKWLAGMQDPSGFVNKLMGGYQESPWAHYQQQQGMRAARNMGSASGLTGSTPLTQFAEQQAQGISSQDMQNWLNNVMGVNTQYGQGLWGEMGMGQHAGDALSGLYGNAADWMGQGAYGKRAGQMQDRNDLWGGLASMFGGGMGGASGQGANDMGDFIKGMFMSGAF